MPPKQLTYGTEGFREASEFLDDHHHEGYSLSLFNSLNNLTAEILCSFSEMIEVIELVSNMEHSFPEWIGINSFTESYVVGFSFTRGRISTPSVYQYIDGELIQRA